MKTYPIETKTYWATPIWFSRIESVNNKDLIRYILNKQATTVKITPRSNRGGWQSHKNLFEEIELNELCVEIWNVCHELWPLVIDYGIKFKQMWAAINKINNWNVIHNHGGNHISGGYYLRVPENSGRIVFRDPAAMRVNSITNLFHEGELCEYQPKEHDLIMWPAYLGHFVEPSKSEEDRIMISFNLDINEPI